ncbi:hypothetical protein HU200_037120 [Digitaria exilis]|uniref:WRKY domain-containing protein n=1 Tax=Digitaria exilis TaxID=1010633 RepID=A0A835BE01_9POAL|nr:hypothetical protein HU200_037120 [Digitaria exilis]
MHMALASFFDSHAADAVFPAAAMAYHRRPCSGGGFPPAAFHYDGAESVFGLAPPQQQPPADAFESLSDEGVSPAVPVAFGTPPPRMPVEQVVPDVVSGGYSHARGAAAAVAEEGSRRTTDRIAFRVRSEEEEVLEDGYKWRKYGKKSVKNSPNPRYTRLLLGDTNLLCFYYTGNSYTNLNASLRKRMILSF